MPIFIKSGDLNLDDVPDLVVTHAYGGNEGVSTLLGNGDGTFAPALMYQVSRHGRLGTFGADIGEVNGDSIPDLVVANKLEMEIEAGNVAVLLGLGDGSLGVPHYFVAHLSPSALAIADIDGDSWLDLVVANSASGDISVLLNQHPVAGDLNCDGLVDLHDLSLFLPSYNVDERGDLDGDGDTDFDDLNILLASYGS